MTPEDIHTRLVAKVNERLERAKAAHRSDLKPGWWNNGGGVVGLRREVNAFLAANDPATVIRHCEADLRRLERHAPDRHYDGTFVCSANCSVWSEPAEEWLPAPHPCTEIRDLAYAYGVSLNDGNEEEHRG